jgi:hypothetical protein
MMAMMFTPFCTQDGQLAANCHLETIQIGELKSVAFSKLRRTVRAMQDKHGFSARPFNMDMCWPVVVWVDNDAQAIKAENRRHKAIYQNPSAWERYEYRATCAFHQHGPD